MNLLFSIISISFKNNCSSILNQMFHSFLSSSMRSKMMIIMITSFFFVLYFVLLGYCHKNIFFAAVNIGNKIGDVEAYFEATHPFLFFIEEETTGSILFAGKLENPLEEDPQPLPAFKPDV